MNVWPNEPALSSSVTASAMAMTRDMVRDLGLRRLLLLPGIAREADRLGDLGDGDRLSAGERGGVRRHRAISPTDDAGRALERLTVDQKRLLAVDLNHGVGTLGGVDHQQPGARRGDRIRRGRVRVIHRSI